LSTWIKAISSPTGALASWFGALPPKRVTWGLVAIFSAWVLLDVMHLRLTSGLSKPSFDAMVRARIFAAAPDPRIVIIDIDEASLARMGREFGRWPWPRDTLATVLDFVERQQPAAVVWDILFSDADKLNPGGDAAFNQAVQRSAHSHFSVTRLPKENDAASQITRSALPGLWGPTTATPNTSSISTVALIPPALPAIAASRLGFNNGYVDADGVLRRYRYLELLGDGSAIQSLPMSVLNAMYPIAFKDYYSRVKSSNDSKDELMAWRKQAPSYPQVNFADVFAKAEGGKPLGQVPAFGGKVVIIGSTAPSLHDIHPTPLAANHTGVDALATAIDNAMNQRHLTELPRWMQAALAIAMCVGLGVWVQFKSVASLAPALFALPAALLALSYLSLNGWPFFLDLNLSAALALVFLALLRVWSTLRRNHWCALPETSQPMAIWPWIRNEPWLDAPLDRLIDAVQRHAPACRIVVGDATVVWPAKLRWPELARCVAVVGPEVSLMQARRQLEPTLSRLAQRSGDVVVLDKSTDREKVANHVLQAWSTLQISDTSSTELKSPLERSL
jgi:adenylate cyclase